MANTEQYAWTTKHESDSTIHQFITPNIHAQLHRTTKEPNDNDEYQYYFRVLTDSLKLSADGYFCATNDEYAKHYVTKILADILTKHKNHTVSILNEIYNYMWEV